MSASGRAINGDVDACAIEPGAEIWPMLVLEAFTNVNS